MKECCATAGFGVPEKEMLEAVGFFMGIKIIKMRFCIRCGNFIIDKWQELKSQEGEK